MRTEEAPKPIELAHEAAFRLGALEVRPATREIVKGASRQVIEPRIMQVLVALVRRRGEVVSRDELIAECWGGRIVGEDAIDRCIARLRRLAEQFGGFKLETVPRVGYRLVEAGTAPRETLKKWRLVALATGLGAVVIVVAAAGGWWLRRSSAMRASAEPIRVAVLPFDTLSSGQDVRYFADDLRDEIVSAFSGHEVQAVSRGESALLRGPGARKGTDRLGVRLLLDGTARSDGAALQVRVHLDDPRAKVTLWSRAFEGPVKDAPGLQKRIAHRIVSVLGCSRDALQPLRGLSDRGQIARYLHACDTFASWDVHVGYDPKGAVEYKEDMRALSAQAPEFAPAHVALAENLSISAIEAPPGQAAPLRREAAAQASRALALDPTSAGAYGARAMLLPPTRWAERERLLRQAVAVNARDPVANFWLGNMLAETGRLQEAAEFAQKSAADDLVYDWGIFSAFITCTARPSDQVLKEIATFRSFEPDSIVARDIQLGCLIDAGRLEDARSLLLSQPGLAGSQRVVEALDATLAAAKSRAPAERAEARRLLLAAASDSPTALRISIGALAGLGYSGDAFALANRFDPAAAATPFAGVFLFSPSNAPLRRDPRFMVLAQRIGLIDYWRTSGHWPDFCAEPGFPYDCQAEAARLAH